MSILRGAVFAVLALLSLATTAARAEQRVLVLDPAASKVSFMLEATGHDVEGALAVKSGRIAFDPATGAASGEIAVDLKSGKTGNDSRDKTMHNEVLEDKEISPGRLPRRAGARQRRARGALRRSPSTG